MHIELKGEPNKHGEIVYSHVLTGRVGTIYSLTGAAKAKFEVPPGMAWYVFPYYTPPYEDGKWFRSLEAAEAYMHSLAYESLYHCRVSPEPATLEKMYPALCPVPVGQTD